MRPAVRVANLSKQYRLGQQSAGYRTLRESIVNACRLAWPRPQKSDERAKEANGQHLLALNDVSFEVRPGEVVGIIGRNGAGKSTLLKILSGVVEPSSGRAEVRGRLGSLLEVGTGFHPELTGRENIYLNGSILGMKKSEINSKFDEIVDFSGVEAFLDTPIKRYSSGMQVRLAFAVAAHLEPEILIIDEVLAVGDAEFQRKCLGKMHDVAGHGRTVLFVSHNMQAVQALCGVGIVLERGKCAYMGPILDAARYYLQTAGASGLTEDLTTRSKFFSRATLIAANDRPAQHLVSGAPLRILIELKVNETALRPVIGINVDTLMGVRVCTASTAFDGIALPRLTGRTYLECQIDNLVLTPGDYSLRLGYDDAKGNYERLDKALHFQVASLQKDDLHAQPTAVHGVVVAHTRWNVMDR